MFREENYISKFFNICNKNLKSDAIFYKSYEKVFRYNDVRIFYSKFLFFLSKFTKERKKIIVISNKRFELYACILSIIVSKNIWIPINPSFPNYRIQKIIDKINPDFLIIESLKNKNSKGIIKICKKKKMKVFDFSTIKRIKSIKLRSIHKVNQEDIAMIFFTSGSTGEPKGVKINYRGFLYSMYEQKRILFKDKKNLIFGDYHDPSFVISLNILLLCFLTKNIISPSTNPYDSVMPVNHIEKNQVNVLITVPSTILRIQKYIKEKKIKNKFKLIIMCGEPFHLELYKFILNSFKSTKIFNCYGSTELSPWVFSHKCEKTKINQYEKYGLIPIGKPFSYTNTMIRKKELLISGKMLSSGYLNSEENKNKFLKISNQLWYRTGDVAKIKNNEFTIKGRLDKIIKIKGYRVDLTEIEKYLRDIDLVKNAICLTNLKGDKFIVALIENSKKTSTEKIVNYLKLYLPNYMIPKRFHFINKFPLNKNGKVDRSKLIKQYQ